MGGQYLNLCLTLSTGIEITRPGVAIWDLVMFVVLPTKDPET